MLRTQALQYAMMCTAPEVCLAMSQSRGTRVIQNGSLDNGQSYPQWTKEFFLIMEVVKEFVVKGYIDVNFDTNPDDSEQ